MESELEKIINVAVARAIDATLTETFHRLHSGDWVEPPEYLNEKQAGAFTGYSPRALEATRLRGEGPAHLKICGRIRYKRTDLIAWMESHRQPAGAK